MQLAQEIRERGFDQDVVWSPVSTQGQAVWVSIGSVNTCVQSGNPHEASKSKAKYILCCTVRNKPQTGPYDHMHA